MRLFSPVSFNDKTTEIDSKYEFGHISELCVRYNRDIHDGIIEEPHLIFQLNITNDLFCKLLERCTLIQEAGYKDMEDFRRNFNGGYASVIVEKNLDMSMELELFPRYDWLHSHDPVDVFRQRIGLFDREKQDLCQMLQQYLMENGNTSLEEQIKNFERIRITENDLAEVWSSPFWDSFGGSVAIFENEYKFEKVGNKEKLSIPITFVDRFQAVYYLDKTDIYKALGYKNAAYILDGIPGAFFYDSTVSSEYLSRRKEFARQGKPIKNEDCLKAYLTFYYENGKQTAYIEFTFDFQQISLKDSVKLSEENAISLEAYLLGSSQVPDFSNDSRNKQFIDFVERFRKDFRKLRDEYNEKHKDDKDDEIDFFDCFMYDDFC